MIRRGVSALVLLVALGACRMDVQLDTRRDAASVPRDAAVTDASRTDARVIDAFALPDADLDALDLDAGPPPPLCAGPGLSLGPVAITTAALAPTLSMIGLGADRRYAILVPPSARPLPATRARLLVLDVVPAVIVDRELDVPSGGAALLTVPAPSTALGEAAFVMIVGDQLSVLDASGDSVGASVTLPSAIDPARQASLAWIDDTHLVYVGSDLSLVSFDLPSRIATVSATALTGSERVLLAPGSVVINRTEPLLESFELSSTLDGTELVRITQPEIHAGFVVGAMRIDGERRWVVRANEEFRTQPKLIRVRNDGTIDVLSGDIMVRGPTDAAQRDGLVAIGGSDGAVIVVDPETGTFETFVEPGAQSLASIARGPDGVAALVVEPGDPDARLMLRCAI